jgi:hypothetical protein
MKRALIIIALLLVASACATQPTTNSTNSTNTTPNANAANSNAQAAKPAAVLSEADLMAKEKQVWDAIKKKDWDSFGGFLSDDQIYVGSSGTQDKKASIEAIKEGSKDVTMADFSITDFKTLWLDKDAVIVSYTATSTATMNGKELPSTPQRNSSVWVSRGGKWQVIFHQDTDVAKEMQPTGTGKAPTPKPAVGLAEADPIAREKQAWDAIEKKDWDAFSSMLTDDHMDVESAGVYDKAGTLNGLSQESMPKMTLSDFKTTKIDDDAAIVTYTVKAADAKPGDAAIHASSIWANRNGKWQAAFHQGTDTQPMPSK